MEGGASAYSDLLESWLGVRTGMAGTLAKGDVWAIPQIVFGILE